MSAMLDALKPLASGVWRGVASIARLAVVTSLVACNGDEEPADEPLPSTLGIVVSAQAELGKAVVLNSSLGASAPRGSTVRWDFGDGFSSTELAPSHVYGKPGTFRVQLTVSTSTGQSTQAESEIRIGRFAALQAARCISPQKTGWCVQWPLAPEVKTLAFRNDLRAFGVSGDGKIVYTESNDGVWLEAGTDSATRSISQIVFADSQVGWALGTTLAAGDGSARTQVLLRTTDGGKHCLRQSRAGQRIRVLSRTHLILENNGTAPGWASQDGGITWIATPSATNVTLAKSGTTVWSYTNPASRFDAGVLFRSRDLGLSFQPALTLRVNESIRDVKFLDDFNGWLLTNYYQYGGDSLLEQSAPVAQTIWTTSDGGATWASFSTAGLPDGAGTNNVHIEPFNANIAIASQLVSFRFNVFTWAFFKTVDGGRRWSSIGPPGEINRLRFIDDKVPWLIGQMEGVSAGATRWAYLTPDLGQTWQRIEVPDEPADSQLLDVTVDDGNALLMRYVTKTYRSVDAGATWGVARVWPAPTSQLQFSDSSFSLGFVNALRGIAVGAGGQLLSTADGGQHWNTESLSVGTSQQSDVGRMQFLTATNGWVAGPFGQYRTQDAGATWTRGLGTAYDFSFLTDLIGWNVSPSPSSTSGLATLVLTLDGGATSVSRPEAPQPMPRPRSVHFADSLVGVLVGDDGSVARTADRGVTWITADSGTTQAFTRVRFADATTAFAVGLNGVVIVTRDGGRTWKPVVTGVLANWRNLYFVDARRGWIVGDYGAIVSTRDGGQTWQRQDSGTLEHLYDVFAVDAETVWTVGERGVIRASATGGD